MGRTGGQACKKLPTSGRLIVAGLVGRQGLRLSTQKKTGNASATEGVSKGRAATDISDCFCLSYSSLSSVYLYVVSWLY